MTHYDTLEVSPRASAEVVRAAYKSLMQRLHPDKAPGDAHAQARAVALAQAYEVLSDPVRRRKYDLGLAAARSDAASTPAAPAPAAWLTSWWLLLSAAILVALAVAFAARRHVDPAAELAAIRHEFASAAPVEARRRELVARKLALIAESPSLQRDELSAKADDMAARTVALLDAPLTAQVLGTPPDPARAVEITIPRASVLLGSFDAVSLVAHMGRHRERLLRDLAARLATESPTALAGPDGEANLKRVLRESIGASLALTPGGDYPSTYFESPGRYGVVDVLLPERFTIVQLSSLR